MQRAIATALLTACTSAFHGRMAATMAKLSPEQREMSENISVCPGEGPRYGNFTCNNDSTHRVCAKLLDSAGQPQSWGP